MMAALTFMMAGCSNNEEGMLPQDDVPEVTPIRVMATVNQPVVTRAGYTADNLDAFALLIENSANGAYSYNKRMTVSDGEWSCADGQQMLWDAARTTVTVTAFAPYADVDFGGTLPVTAKSDQSSAANVQTSDFLLVKQTVNPDSDLTAEGKLSVSMNHLMSKLLIKLTVNGTESADMSKMGDMAINGALTEGTCDLSAAAPVVLPLADATASTVTPYKGTEAYECILLPQTVAEGFSLNFSYDGRLYIWNAEEAVTLQQGVEHTLTLNINTTSTAQMVARQARCLATGSLVEWK